MSRVPRILAILMIVAGAIMIVAGSTTYYLVQRELADEKIVVADDAENFAGEPVEGPLTAYSQATVIKKHAAEIADGQTYAQLEQDDPRRETVMNSSFLRSSLFTSVLAFGVSFLVIALGVLFILVGVAIMSLAKAVKARVSEVAAAPEEQLAVEPAEEPAAPVEDLPPPQPVVG